MACGLGAIALILVLVKDDISSNSPKVDEDEIDSLGLIVEKEEKKTRDIKDLIEEIQKNSEEIDKKNNLLQSAISIQNKTSEIIKKSIEKSKNTITQIEIERNKAAMPKSQKKGYLSGCNIEGQKSIFLIDSSSSMLHSKINEIIRLKFTSDKIKKNTLKWTQAKEAAKWMINKVPDKGKFVLAHFNENLEIFNSKDPWIEKGEKEKITKTLMKLSEVVPKNGTNLYKAFSGLEGLFKFNSVYVVSDGLPTYGKKIDPLSCKDKIASPKCRQALFNQATDFFIKKYKPASLNFIILPLEADAQAAFSISRAALKTNGCFLTPSIDWP